MNAARVPAVTGSSACASAPALFSGTLHAGRRDGDGFEVRALLPYPAGAVVEAR